MSRIDGIDSQPSTKGAIATDLTVNLITTMGGMTRTDGTGTLIKVKAASTTMDEITNLITVNETITETDGTGTLVNTKGARDRIRSIGTTMTRNGTMTTTSTVARDPGAPMTGVQVAEITTMLPRGSDGIVRSSGRGCLFEGEHQRARDSAGPRRAGIDTSYTTPVLALTYWDVHLQSEWCQWFSRKA